jgi:hypothetical protein
MWVQKMYCSGCDREVAVLMSNAVDHDAQANVHDPELVCLAVGDSCTGALCPLGAAEPNAMVGRLVRSGLPLDGLSLVRGWCGECERETEVALYGGDKATCTECGLPVHRPRSGGAAGRIVVE